MDIEEFSEKVVQLGFMIKYKKIETGPIMIIWKEIEGMDYFLPVGHLYQDKTYYSIYYNTVWDSLGPALQEKLENLMKEYSERMRRSKIIYRF